MSTMTESLNLTEKTGDPHPFLEGAVNPNAGGLLAGTTLRFVTGSSDIDVRLANDTAISALRFEIVFDKKINYRAPDLGARVQTLNNYINFQDNIITFVFLDIDGKGIAAGNGTIIRIPLEGDQRFDVSAVYASTRASGISEIGYTISKDVENEESLVLEQNDPNPFTGSTRLDFQIPSEAETKLIIYDVGGALIRTLIDSKLEPGFHSAEWDGCDDSGRQVESGIYLYKLYAGVYSVTRKMVFLK